MRLKHIGLHATVLYLDKGFCSGEIITFLQRTQQRAVLACPIRGKKGGIRVLCQGRGSFSTDYTFTDGTHARLALVNTWVQNPKIKRKQRKWLVIVLVNLDWTPHQVYSKYRRRFGIEASYRILRQVKVLTNSRNPALRFFLLGLGLLMQNVWVLVRWLLTRCPGKGRHKLMPILLRFDRFRKLLMRAVERFYPPPLVVSVFVSPQSVIHGVSLIDTLRVLSIGDFRVANPIGISQALMSRWTGIFNILGTHRKASCRYQHEWNTP